MPESITSAVPVAVSAYCSVFGLPLCAEDEQQEMRRVHPDVIADRVHVGERRPAIPAVEIVPPEKLRAVGGLRG